MFGITSGQNSVSVHVHNFTPYFYVKVNTQSVSAQHFGPDDLQKIRDMLNRWVLGNSGGDINQTTPVKAVELIKDKASVMNYQKDKAVFLKIYTGLPKYVN